MCVVENRSKLPEALYQGNVLAVQMFFIALAQDDILVTDSHIVMFDFTKYSISISVSPVQSKCCQYYLLRNWLLT